MLFENGARIFEWVVAFFIVVVLSFIVYKEYYQRDDDGTPNHSIPPIPATDVNDHDIKKRRQEEEEARRRNTIFKLFQSEHIQEKITNNQIIRRGRSESVNSSTTASTEECQSIGSIRSDTYGEECNDSDPTFDEEEGHGVVVLHDLDHIADDNNSNKDTGEKTVANQCAICLEEYHEGETIVWSSNKNCRHAFHRHCLTEYLVTVKAEDTYPCPCCRQNFFFQERRDDNSESNEE